MGAFGGEFCEYLPWGACRWGEQLRRAFSSRRLVLRGLPFLGLGDSSATGESMAFQNPEASESTLPVSAVVSLTSGTVAGGILTTLVEISTRGAALGPARYSLWEIKSDSIGESRSFSDWGLRRKGRWS